MESDANEDDNVVQGAYTRRPLATIPIVATAFIAVMRKCFSQEDRQPARYRLLANTLCAKVYEFSRNGRLIPDGGCNNLRSSLSEPF